MKKRLKTISVRLQNKNVLVAIISGVLLLLTNVGVIDVPHAEHINYIANGILTIFVTVGIVSDPESHVKDQEPNL
jgi:phi LC3 family holin